jgi:hypothetical protein
MVNQSGNPQGPRRVSKPSRTEWWILGAALLASAALIVIALMAPKLARAADDASKNKVPIEIPKLDGVWMLDKEHSDDPSKLRAPGGGMHGGGGGGMGGHGGWGGGGGGGGWGGGGGHHHGGGGGGEGAPPDGEGGPDGGPPSGGDHARPQPQPAKLVIFRDGAAFNIDDGSGHARELTWQADAPDTGGVVPAHWDGKKLVAEMVSTRGTRSVTYDLDKDGKALTMTLHFQRPDGESVSLKSRYKKYEGTEE